MKKCEIVKNSEEFSEMIKNSKFIKAKNFTIYYKKKENTYPLFGITVSNKTGNAVKRNKLKRQLRNIIDKNKSLFKNNEKYIIIIRASAALKEYKDLELDIITAMKER